MIKVPLDRTMCDLKRKPNLDELFKSLLENAEKSPKISKDVETNLPFSIRSASKNILLHIFRLHLNILQDLKPDQVAVQKVFLRTWQVFIENLLVDTLDSGSFFNDLSILNGSVLEYFKKTEPIDQYDESFQRFLCEIYFCWFQLKVFAVYGKQIGQFGNVLQSYNSNAYFRSLLDKNPGFILRDTSENEFEMDVDDSTSAAQQDPLVLLAEINELLCENNCDSSLVSKLYHFLFDDIDGDVKSSSYLKMVRKMTKYSFELKNEDIIANKIHNLQLILETDIIAKKYFSYLFAIFVMTKNKTLQKLLLRFLNANGESCTEYLCANWSEFLIAIQLLNDDSCELVKEMIFQSRNYCCQYLDECYGFLQNSNADCSQVLTKALVLVYDDPRLDKSDQFSVLLKQSLRKLLTDHMEKSRIDFNTIILVGTLLKYDPNVLPSDGFQFAFDFLKQNLEIAKDIDICLKFLVLFVHVREKNDYSNDILQIIEIVMKKDNYRNRILIRHVLECLPSSILEQFQLQIAATFDNFQCLIDIVPVLKSNEQTHEMLNRIFAKIEIEKCNREICSVFLKFAQVLIYNKKIVLKSNEIDKILIFSYQITSRTDLIELFDGALSLINRLVILRHDLMSDKEHLITQQIRFSLLMLQVALKESTDVTRPLCVERLTKCAFEIQKMTDTFLKLKRNFKPISASLAVDLIKYYGILIKYKDVKVYLGNAIKNLLKMYDKHDMMFSRNSLTPKNVLILNQLDSEKNRSRFDGKI